ncbi:odorant receptor 10-like [Anoplolepis gracilipes]|uniref:odorant receptor 10-like n=1 Tax=Anoplolepis gracilipes TaxID=354296 RepID=UPI003BA0CC42
MKASKYSANYQDFLWAVKLNRYSLELSGLWPKSKQTNWEKRMCNLRTFLTFSTIVFAILIPALHSLIRIYSDILLMIDNLQYTIVMIICVIKIIIFWWKKTVITPVIDMIMNDWTKTKTPQERTIMIARARTARIIASVAYVIMAGAMSVSIGMSMFGYSMRYVTNVTDPGRILPYQSYYIYDVTKSPQYELTFTSQAITMILCAMLYTGVDNFLSLVVFHICGQLDILKNRLIHMNKTNYLNVLKSVVMDHIQLFSFLLYRAIAIIKDTYSALFLILFTLFGSLCICYGFLLTNMFEDGYHISFSQLAFLVTIVTNIFGHMCMYCALGEFLTAQCDQIHYAAYCNEWYITDPRNARCLVLLMIRTNKPLYLSAGRVFPLTMATFCNLIKTSAGYISVLLTKKN